MFVKAERNQSVHGRNLVSNGTGGKTSYIQQKPFNSNFYSALSSTSHGEDKVSVLAIFTVIKQMFIHAVSTVTGTCMANAYII